MSRRKQIVDYERNDPNQNRTLSLLDLTMFGIGNTIGAGIFALSGVAA